MLPRFTQVLLSAWTNAPFVRGAKKVADIRLIQLPYQERLADMPESDLEAEGGLWADKEEFLNLFGDPDLIVWVVRFELLQLADGCRDGYDQAARDRFCNKVDNP